jgi:hypothetical protein
LSCRASLRRKERKEEKKKGRKEEKEKEERHSPQREREREKEGQRQRDRERSTSAVLRISTPNAHGESRGEPERDRQKNSIILSLFFFRDFLSNPLQLPCTIAGSSQAMYAAQTVAGLSRCCKVRSKEKVADSFFQAFLYDRHSPSVKKKTTEAAITYRLHYRCNARKTWKT